MGRAPLIALPSGDFALEVWYGDDDGVVHHNLAGLELPFPFVADDAIVAPLAFDAGQVLYLGDAQGHLYAVNATTAALRWRLDLGAPLAGSPLISRGFVYAATTDGRLFALERGGNVAPSNWWAREGGNNAGNSMAGACSSGGTPGPLGLLLALLALSRGASPRRTTRVARQRGGPPWCRSRR